MRTSGVQNLAQVYTRLKYLGHNNRRCSRELLAALEGQRFANNEVEGDPSAGG